MRKIIMIKLLALLACGLACGEKAGTSASILSVIPDKNNFHLSVCAPEGSYNLERTYKWECTSRNVDVVFDSAANTSGTIHFVFRDDSGRTVYERTFNDPRGFFSQEDIPGACPGTWSICIHVINFKGHVNISSIAD